MISVQKKRYSHIFWDWNGTLLDDVDWCITTVNMMLEQRNKTMLKEVSDYHEVFCFPVVEYYKKVGFDLEREAFEALAQEYMAIYHGDEGRTKLELHKGAESVLGSIQDSGISQVILSASSQENLLAQMHPFKIRPYFEEILGISDIYARSKVEIGLEYLSRNTVTRGILIGDTTHDYEVAQAMGLDCLLVARGHQSRERLKTCNVPVCENLWEVLDYIK